MNILKELYYGNVCEASRRINIKDSKLRKEEYDLYEKIKNMLPEDKRDLMDRFMDIIGINCGEELEDRYIQGVKTGVLIGVEASNIELGWIILWEMVIKYKK